jgi:hypothetical protein
VDEKDIPSMFLDLRLAILGMQSQVPAVEAEYAVDCRALKTSIQNAAKQLQAYLSGEGAGVVSMPVVSRPVTAMLQELKSHE